MSESLTPTQPEEQEIKKKLEQVVADEIFKIFENRRLDFPFRFSHLAGSHREESNYHGVYFEQKKEFVTELLTQLLEYKRNNYPSLDKRNKEVILLSMQIKHGAKYLKLSDYAIETLLRELGGYDR